MGCCCGCPIQKLPIEVYHQIICMDMNRGGYIKFKDKWIGAFHKIQAGGVAYVTRSEVVIIQDGCCCSCCGPDNRDPTRYFRIEIQNIEEVHRTEMFRDNLHRITPCYCCSDCCGGGTAMIDIRGKNENGNIHISFVVDDPYEWITAISQARGIDFHNYPVAKEAPLNAKFGAAIPPGAPSYPMQPQPQFNPYNPPMAINPIQQVPIPIDNLNMYSRPSAPPAYEGMSAPPAYEGEV